MLDNIRGSAGLNAPGPEQARPELAINAPDPVLGQPVEQEIQLDTTAFQERADELSLSNAASTIEVQRGVRQNEALVELRASAETALASLEERTRNVREQEVITPEGSVANFSAVQPTLEVITQELATVVDTESVLFNDILDQEGTFFTGGVPDLTYASGDEEVVSEAMLQVEQFINTVNEEIANNRATIVNTGAQAAEVDTGNQSAAPANGLEPLTNEQQVQQTQQEAVRQIQEQAEIAVETQNNLSTGTLLELYNS